MCNISIYNVFQFVTTLAPFHQIGIQLLGYLLDEGFSQEVFTVCFFSMRLVIGSHYQMVNLWGNLMWVITENWFLCNLMYLYRYQIKIRPGGLIESGTYNNTYWHYQKCNAFNASGPKIIYTLIWAYKRNKPFMVIDLMIVLNIAKCQKL